MLDKLIGPVTGILDKFVEDKDLRATLQHEMDMQLHNANLAQIEVNKAEASSSSLFKGGWRPFVGWTCGVALLYHFLLQPIIIFGLSAAGIDFILPEFDMGSLMTILMGMLGLGGLRTYEKKQNLTK
jgi:hypothetical protein|tara:strand:- start:17 stop:397 length:381 start_codon:yes stop_codon:yes gene_type:complete